jgi:flavorubredoxin
MITNLQSGTNIQEVADGIYRINTPVPIPGGSPFNFNQYLVVDDQPMLFHMGQKQLFPLVRQAIDQVMPVNKLRYLAFSHFEADECGALNQFLDLAPEAETLCSRVSAMVAINDFAIRTPRVLQDGEDLVLGRKTMRWFDTPHLPHGWDSGLMMDMSTGTLFCGDLFTQGGAGEVALTTGDILGPSEAFRAPMDYYAHAPNTRQMLERLAQQHPSTLACMHGSAWSGDGAQLLRELAARVKPVTEFQAAA